MVDEPADLGFQVRDRRRRSPDAGSGPGDSAGSAPREPDAARATPRPAPTLARLFVMLASLALAALEGFEDPATGRRRPDLPQAAEFIDLLILLREKTEGHRTPEETESLTGLIYDLQLRYVRATTAAPGA